MKALPAITDPVYVPREYSWLDRQFLKLIKDKRDLPFAYVVFRISIIILPMAFLIYTSLLPNWLWWITVVVYQLLNFIFRAPFGLMMHCISHRRLFKRQFNFLYKYIIWIVCPFLGHTPETYFSHHMGMHHAENNMPGDDSSTMAYQRDSLKDFLKYFLHFLFLGFKGLLQYLFSHKKRKLAQNAMAGELSFFAFCIVMCFVNLHATLAVFIFTFLFSRLIMMLGNWTQHAFIDPNDPSNHYKNAINCINIKYNHKCWNDGYHSSHHARPSLHWMEHPKSFMQNLDKYAENRSVVFDNMDFAKIFLALLTKRYDKLAKNFVNINNTFSSDEEIIAMLKEKTRKFSPESIAALSHQAVEKQEAILV
jgi:fatty acid desaturase